MMVEERKGLSAGFLLFVGIVFAAIGVGFRFVVMDDRAGEERGWMTAHAWLFLVIAGIAITGFGIAKLAKK